MAAVRETLRIGQEAVLPVEIFHLKVSGKDRAGNHYADPTKVYEELARYKEKHSQGGH